MIWKVHVTSKAEHDLASAADHIEFVLLNPDAADALFDEAEKKIGVLNTFPEKHPLVDDPILNAWGIRYTIVKNYLAFYVISEKDHTVYVVRFLHQKRDWIRILKKEGENLPLDSAFTPQRDHR